MWVGPSIQILAKHVVGGLVHLIDLLVLDGTPALALVAAYRVSGGTKKFALTHVQCEVLPDVQLSPSQLVGLQLTDSTLALLY